MSCIDFGLTSYCSTVSNVATLCANPQSFLTYQIAGYNHPSFGGCEFFQNKINNWTSTLASVTGIAYRRQLKAKIDWANCMIGECCEQPNGPIIYGCMDDGNKSNDYLNNQGTNANPQFGSVTPNTPALNYYPAAQIDNGTCLYSQPVHGCKDPSATNYDPNADMDCGNNTVSDFNISYTNWHGIQPPGSWTPYGDTSCCTYVDGNESESESGLDINELDTTTDTSNFINVKSSYIQNNNQTVEVISNDSLFLIEEENGTQKALKFSGRVLPGSIKNIFNITFKTKDGYYYLKSPSLIMNFPGSEDYKIKVESERKNARGYVIEKTFNVKYTNQGFDILEQDGHNIEFITKIAKEVDTSTKTKVKEIKSLRVDTSTVSGNGGSKNISVVGTPGSTFSLTVKDKNGRNVLPYSNKIIKTAMIAISASGTLQLNNAIGLEVGMVVLNDQKRNVKITGISDPVKTNVDAINETSTTHVSISSFLTFAANDNIVFAKEADITGVEIPNSGIYSFTQDFPPLEKFKRTLNGGLDTLESSTTATLDYTKDLEENMKVTGTGVDGNDTIISSITDATRIVIPAPQGVDDGTELTFEMPDNRYDITLYPLMAVLGDDIPRYSSEDCDTLPTYSIYQYVDPIVQIVPSSALSNVTTTGTITLTGKANKGAGANGDIAINMVATKSDGSLTKSREPRFSSVNSELSDFSNTLNTITKKVREGDCRDKDIVHLNNVTGIRVGMIVTGDDIDTNKTITVKSITGTAVKLSEKQTIRKDSALTFSSMFNMHISGLTATLSPNGGRANGICTVTGKGQITTFGIDSFTSIFSFDNFLSI